jgi:hypothetical protein
VGGGRSLDLTTKEKGRKMETKEKTLEQLLEEGENRFPEIVGLYQWSLNYEAGKTPFTIFIDLIGYSDNEIGMKVFDYSESIYKTLGYLEIGYLGDALKEYADKGESAYDFVVSLIEAEGRE